VTRAFSGRITGTCGSSSVFAAASRRFVGIGLPDFRKTDEPFRPSNPH
jgi:hypothetical protein